MLRQDNACSFHIGEGGGEVPCRFIEIEVNFMLEDA